MKKIIVCIDGSPYTESVCQAGIWAQKKLDKDLLFLHAIEKNQSPQMDNLSGNIGLGARSALLNEMADLDAKRSKLAREIGKELLVQSAQLAEQQGGQRIEQVQRNSSITEAICDLEKEARLIVIGRSGQGHQQNFQALGSHIEQIIRQVQTPIVISSHSFSEPQNFMLAYDGRETADKAVQTIIEGGLLHGLTCHLVSIKNNQSHLNEKFKNTENMLREKGFDVHASMLEGPIFDTLIHYQKQHSIEMLVMGAFSHSKLAQIFLGSNTLKMLEHAQLPLIVLR